ncbi:MAG: hypothetical protein JSW39_02525, partial [Desulfobacterales bacterium]
MNGSSSDDTTKQRHSEPPEPSGDSLDELRRLLLGPYQQQLADLQKRLDSRELQAGDLSRVLPEAIALRSPQDRELARALAPMIEQAIKTSIRKDRRFLVDAPFPVMGPAIRRAIAAAIQGMVQSFNQILESSLSVQGLKWRWEALRTRKSFGEVVLLHTLVYQVEQVFLIHKDSGLVLQHVVAKSVVAQNPDTVSAMLTAIKDFVQDSFGAQGGENLETVRVGERSLWIEQGSQAILAAVMRGNPPPDFHSVLREALAEIHFQKSEALEAFDGDTAAFEAIRNQLESCLQAQFKKAKPPKSAWGWILLAALIALIGTWSWHTYREHRRWANYVAGLHAEPGVVVTSIQKKSGK